MSFSLSQAVSHVSLNPIIKNMMIVKLFQVDSATKKCQKEYATKVTSRNKFNALMPTQDMSQITAFNMEIIAHATGVARHKVLDICVNGSITAESIHDIASLKFMVQRRNAVCDLVIKEMARAQFIIIKSEINSGKNYNDLFSNKTFHEWYYTFNKPLHPQTEGLIDNTNLVDATYQIVHCGYFEMTNYLLSLVEEEHKARFYPNAAE